MTEFPIKIRGRLHAICENKRVDNTNIIVCFFPHNSYHTCSLEHRGLIDALTLNQEFDFLINGIHNLQMQISIDHKDVQPTNNGLLTHCKLLSSKRKRPSFSL